MVDFACNGLGEIAYQKKDYARALRFFTDGTEKIAAAQKLKEISLGPRPGIASARKAGSSANGL
jgi:hypothetical protein